MASTELGSTRYLADRFGLSGRVAIVTGGVLYLVSPAASLVTGHILHIDGGWLAR